MTARWYPSARPGVLTGTVVDDEGIIHNGYMWWEALAYWPDVERMTQDLPVVIDRPEGE